MTTTYSAHSRCLPGPVRFVRGSLIVGAVGNGLGILWAIATFALFAVIDAALGGVGDGDVTGRIFTADVLSVTAACVSLWTIRRVYAGITDGDPEARTTLSLLTAGNLVVSTVAMAILTGSPVVAVVWLVLAAPCACVVPGLLWFPESSRRHFGDIPRVFDDAPTIRFAVRPVR